MIRLYRIAIFISGVNFCAWIYDMLERASLFVVLLNGITCVSVIAAATFCRWIYEQNEQETRP